MDCMASSAEREQTIASRTASLHSDYVADYGAGQGSLVPDGLRKGIQRLVGPVVRAFTHQESPDVCEVKNRIETLQMMQLHQRDELVAMIQRCHNVSRVIASQMLDTRLELLAKNGEIQHG